MTDTSRPFTDSPIHRFTVLWLPIIAWCGLIFYLSSIPDLRITREWWDLWARKAAHMLEYAVLSRLLIRAFSGSTAWPRKKVLAAAFIVAVLYACSDEYHQGFVRGRVASPVDVLIDAVGAGLGLKML